MCRGVDTIPMCKRLLETSRAVLHFMSTTQDTAQINAFINRECGAKDLKGLSEFILEHYSKCTCWDEHGTKS